jgi:hypothetical protein
MEVTGVTSVPKLEKINIELTPKEAKMLMVVIGNIGGGGDIRELLVNPLYRKLSKFLTLSPDEYSSFVSQEMFLSSAKTFAHWE